MNNTKSVFSSKTFWASLIAFLGVILGWDVDLQSDLVSCVDEIIVLVGVVGALWGRLVAQTKLTVTTKTK